MIFCSSERILNSFFTSKSSHTIEPSNIFTILWVRSMKESDSKINPSEETRFRALSKESKKTKKEENYKYTIEPHQNSERHEESPQLSGASLEGVLIIRYCHINGGYVWYVRHSYESIPLENIRYTSIFYLFISSCEHVTYIPSNR